VIAREGCVAASIRKVAQHAGYSTGAITYYFADRNDLLARVVEDVFDDFDQWLHPDDGVEGVRAMSEYQLLRRSAPSDQAAGVAAVVGAREHRPEARRVIERPMPDRGALPCSSITRRRTARYDATFRRIYSLATSARSATAC
jgi:AcrR family transcriptional regulator